MTERDDLMQLVARNIERLMDERGLNPMALGRAAGLGRNVVYDVLKGKSASPRLDTLNKISEGLGVNLIDLLIEPDPEGVKDALVRKIDALPAARRAKALQMVDLLAEPERTAVQREDRAG